jgi:exopolysaccharide biosynthesis predicted pyruvyltransferase EpsI
VSDDALLTALRRQVHDTVRRVTPPGPVALLDFPDYANPGDSAIWLGALSCLSALGFDPPVYMSDMRSFDERSLRRALPPGGGAILLTGGGNLGDLWPRHQAFRERILRAFPDYAVVQLPQSIHFEGQATLAAARQVFAAHPRYSLLVRDQRSFDLAVEMGCSAELCPDLAFCLTDKDPALRPSGRGDGAAGVLWLMRSDQESSGVTPPALARTIDWAQAKPDALDRLATRLRDYLARAANSGQAPSHVSRAARRALSALYPVLAQRRFRRGCGLLRSARVVVTDRLHGHTLSLLLGVRHVMIGDRYGKLRAFVDTWTSSSALLRWADSAEEAAVLARDLAMDTAIHLA